MTDKYTEMARKVVGLYDEALVHRFAQALRKAVEDETEACAKVVENRLIYTGPGGVDPEPIQLILATAIRERNKIADKRDNGKD